MGESFTDPDHKAHLYGVIMSHILLLHRRIVKPMEIAHDKTFDRTVFQVGEWYEIWAHWNSKTKQWEDHPSQRFVGTKWVFMGERADGVVFKLVEGKHINNKKQSIALGTLCFFSNRPQFNSAYPSSPPYIEIQIMFRKIK